MSVGLRGAAVVAGVEEGQKTLLVAARVCLPCLQDGVGRLQIVLFEHMCLLLVGFCRQDEVLGYYGVLVQDEEVSWVGGWYVSQVEGWWGVLERVDLLFGRRILELRNGFLRERRAVS